MSRLASRQEGTKDILGLWIETSEGAKFWLRVMTELKNRGVEDILIAVVDGLKGFPEAIAAVFPPTIVQTCIVHLIRNSMDFAAWKDRKPIAAELKAIYRATDTDVARRALEDFDAGVWGRLPQMEGDKEPRRTFKTYPIGFFHVDIAEVQTAQGKLYLFVAIDRTSKFAVAQLVHKANTQTARAFLEALVAAVPYRVEIVLTDNGIQFADLPKNRSGPTAKLRGHPFDRVCREHGIEHRLTKPNHPWTNGQVERMNRTIKEATVKRYHYESHGQLVRHLDDFVAAYNFARRLKTLNGLTPYEFICKRWTIDPERFRLNPLQQMPGLNT